MSLDNRQQQQRLDLHEAGTVSRVHEYEFEPIRGYPMLHWAGKRPFTSTQYYPAQHKETYGPDVNGWRNKLYWGDNLQVMSHLLKEYRGRIQLIYIDPPFDSKANYARAITLRGRSATGDRSAFEEKQYTDIWTNDEYLQFMFERLVLCKELLSTTGSMYLHCDWHKGHYLRCIMDEVFGPNAFLSEVMWRRSSSTGSSKALSNSYPANHDTIFLYSRSETYTYNRQYNEYGAEYLKRFRYDDDDGRGPYRLSDLNTYSRETLERLRQDNRLVEPETPGAHYSYKRYLNETQGVVVDDVWTEETDDMWLDINFVNPMAREGTGYPTQKPEALLERILITSSNPGDLIFDCFMGSGTTQKVALKLGRRFIGADINLGAVQITTKRLLSVADELSAKPPTLGLDGDETPVYYTGFEVYNVNNYDIFRNPVEAKDLLIQALEINPLQPGSLFDGENDGRMVKILPVNRIATRQDLNELITGMDYKSFERRLAEHPNQPVEKITLVCMGHEPDLAAFLQHAVQPYRLDVEVVDILRDKQDLQFKRDSEASIVVRDGELVIEAFYPMNLLAKLSLQKEYVEDWRELVDSIMVDWNYDGAILQPTVIDVPERNELVKGHYRIPVDAGTIRIKITDLLSESLETELPNS